MARDTKLGKEEITRDIPNVGEEALKDLDESGIVRIGAEVKRDDILVGKITPKGETQLSPEERLLRAIFGEKAGDVRDTSLRVPPGVAGTVIGAQVFSRAASRRTSARRRSRSRRSSGCARTRKTRSASSASRAMSKVRELLVGKPAREPVARRAQQGRLARRRRRRSRSRDLDEIPRRTWREIQVEDAARRSRSSACCASVDEQAA